MARLDSIHLYPIKSTAGMALTRALVTEEGISRDRRYMVIKPDGSFITARTHPQLQQVVATPMEAGLQLAYPGQPPLLLQERAFRRTPQATGVWGDSFTALHTTDQADRWFSQIVGEPAHLLWLGERSARFRSQTGTRVSFADGYPLLLIGQASLDDLNLRSDALHRMSQFRTNLVVSDTRPFEEDGWARIRIGEVEFRIAKPCSRCIMTTVEPGSTSFNALKEPLATLSRYRCGADGDVYFGQNLVALNEGWIEAGSEIEVLERVRPTAYPDAAPRKLTLRCVDRQPLARDLESFWFEVADGEPLPGDPSDYRPGRHLPLFLDLDGERVQRRYSLISSPDRPDHLGIAVRRLEHGRVSRWLYEHLRAGDTLLSGVPGREHHPGTAPAVARPHQAVQLRIGERLLMGDNQGSVLDQANRQGVQLPWSCRAGLCGRCKQTLRAGEVAHPDAPAITAAERAEGKILACCAVPLTDLVIEAQ